MKPLSKEDVFFAKHHRKAIQEDLAYLSISSHRRSFFSGKSKYFAILAVLFGILGFIIEHQF